MTRASPLRVLKNAAGSAQVGARSVLRRADFRRPVAPKLDIAIYTELDAVEDAWRRFSNVADCTAFQSFDWLAAWHRHIGARNDVLPVIVVGSYARGGIAFIMPLAVEKTRLARKLCWLGQELCDYTAPLLARDFSRRVPPERFRALWRELLQRLQRDPRTRHDVIALEKMPHQIGGQSNPFTALQVTANPSGAHLTHLGDDWQTFYFDKRSSATRRHDRAKRRRLGEFGDVRFVHGRDGDDARHMLDALMQQKSRSLASRGVCNVFARPGCREFFLELATNPKTRHLIHLSRIEVGSVWAAINLGIVFGDCYYHVVASYTDGGISRYGPGALHLRELMAHAIGLGLRRFDFTIGDERYKLEWADTHLALCDHVVAATWRGRPISACRNAQNRIKRAIKQTPAAWRLLCAARMALAGLRRVPQ